MESCVRGGEGALGVVLQHAPPWAFCIVKNKYELCTVRGVEEKKLKKQVNMDAKKVIADLQKRHPNQPLFLQAASEVIESVEGVYNEHPMYEKNRIIERIVGPDRAFMFKVPWEDDKGEIHVNIGYRVQFNGAIGPYKGGVRFAPNVTIDTMKFLGFEQTFKNALTTLPMGGAKGGSDFDPTGRSDAEVRRFCEKFMLELWRHIGPETDVPAGDLGVGGREIGYMYGMYKKLTHTHTGTFTGKGMNWGGSKMRPEATGFGAVFFLNHMINAHKDVLKGKTVAISGFGNVAWGAAKKATELGAKVVTVSGPDGYVFIEKGMTSEMVDYMLELRAMNLNKVEPFAKKFAGTQYVAGKKPWEVKCDVAMPCATQNELAKEDAELLIKNGVKYVAEVSNMGCQADAIHAFIKARTPFGPGKAVNAGGVSASGLEMSQNALKLSWTGEEVISRLEQIMQNIFEASCKYGKESDGYMNLVKGANVAGFMKVADAMCDLGLVY